MRKTFVAFAGFAFAASIAFALPQDAAKKQVEAPVKINVADLKKRDVETPVRAAAVRPDVGKSMVEFPVLELLAAAEADMRRVAPGLVSWHPSFEKACEAAKASGNPVLLFQLLGNLDEEFC